MASSTPSPPQDDLIEAYREIHNKTVYGASSLKYVRYLRPHIQILKPKSILDFGCGQSVLLERLGLGEDVQTYRYDPAIAEYAKLPDIVADLLINIDVLEHIEEHNLDDVISTMRKSCKNALIAVDTVPAACRLPDGRNAHVTLKPHAWWKQKLGQHFDTLIPIRVPRRGRAAFMTWRYDTREQLRFRALRAKEDAIYYAKRLVGKHKPKQLPSSISRPHHSAPK